LEPLTFRQVDGPYSIAFREDNRGQITHLFTDLTPMLSFEKLNWYETSGFNMALLLICGLIFLSIIPVGMIHYIQNRRASDNRIPAPGGARVARWIIVGISILNLLFVAGTVLWVNTLQMTVSHPHPNAIRLCWDWVSRRCADRWRTGSHGAGRKNSWGHRRPLYYTLNGRRSRLSGS
jgi:hypothetical protein